MEMQAERGTDYYEDEIDLGELLAVLWRRKGLMALIVVIGLLLGAFYSLSDSRNVTTSQIKADFDGIDKHLYPDGSRFDMYDLVAPDILSRAALAIEDEDRRQAFLQKPRGYVTIDAFIPGEVKSEMEARRKKGETYIYLPNQFTLRLSEPGGGMFDSEEKKGILNGIVSAYEYKFSRDFVQKPLLAVNFPDDLLSRNDYGDVVSILGSQVQSYTGFLEERIKEAGYYRSPRTGQSFVDIKSELEKIRDIDLQELTSVIVTLSMTKQTDMLQKKYQYRIREMEMQSQKKEGEAAIARELLEDVWGKDRSRMYSRSDGEAEAPSMVVMDATVMEKLSQKEYISFLVRTALEASVQANDLGVDKAMIEQQLASLRDRTSDGSGVVSHEYMEGQLQRLKERITALGHEANRLNAEYLASRYADVIQTLTQPVSHVIYRMNPAKALVLSLVAGLVLAVFLAFVVEYLAGVRRRRVQPDA